MSYVVVKDGNLLKFAVGYRKWWQIWKKKVQLSVFKPHNSMLDIEQLVNDAQRCYGDAEVREDVSVGRKYGLEALKYFVIVKGSRKSSKLRYFGDSSALAETNYYSYDIHDATIFKSPQMARDTLNRLRAEGADMVDLREVYLSLVNDLISPNIVVSVKDKEHAKFIGFMQSYEAGVMKPKVETTDNVKKARKFTFDEYCNLFKNIHIWRKDLALFPKMYKGERNLKPEEVEGKEEVVLVMHLDKD